MAPKLPVKALAVCLAVLAVCAAAAPQNVTTAALVDNLSLEELDAELQVRHKTNPRCR